MCSLVRFGFSAMLKSVHLMKHRFPQVTHTIEKVLVSAEIQSEQEAGCSRLRDGCPCHLVSFFALNLFTWFYRQVRHAVEDFPIFRDTRHHEFSSVCYAHEQMTGISISSPHRHTLTNSHTIEIRIDFRHFVVRNKVFRACGRAGAVHIDLVLNKPFSLVGWCLVTFGNSIKSLTIFNGSAGDVSFHVLNEWVKRVGWCAIVSIIYYHLLSNKILTGKAIEAYVLQPKKIPYSRF